MNTQHTPQTHPRGGIVDAMDRHGPRITDSWSGERAVLVPALAVGALASVGMAFLERMY